MISELFQTESARSSEHRVCAECGSHSSGMAIEAGRALWTLHLEGLATVDSTKLRHAV